MDELLAIKPSNGKSVPTARAGFPVLRMTALRGGRVDLAERKIGAWTADQAAPFLVRKGDVLLSRGNGSIKLVGRAALVIDDPDPVAYPDTFVRLTACERVLDSRYLIAVWNSEATRIQIESAARTTAGIYKINQAVISSIRLPLPPITEQRRIISVLDEQLAALARGMKLVEISAQRSRNLVGGLLNSLAGATWPAHWRTVPVAEAGRVDLGRQRHPDWHSGSHPRPYLRVANVFEDRLDLSDVMEMDFPPEVFERFKLVPGDILLNEGQSPHLLGRPAMYRGEPEEIAFTNSLLRFRANPDVLPEWALLVFRHYMHSGRFTREVRITTNIAHLSAARFKSIEFPIPPLAEQQRLIEIAHRDMSHQADLERSLETAVRRAEGLRQAVLDAAFRGELVDQDPADEPADVLLARIRAEREAAALAARKTRMPRTRKATAP